MKAWVAAGGDLRFLHHVGAGLARIEAGDLPTAGYGTSAGALFLYCLFGIRSRSQTWLQAANALYQLCLIELAAKGRRLVKARGWPARLWSAVRGDFSLYDLAPVRQLLEEKVRVPEAPDVLVAVEDFESPGLPIRYARATVPAVIASSSVPVTARAVGQYVDGGVRDQLPLKRPIDDGYRSITAFMTKNRPTPPPAEVLHLAAWPKSRRYTLLQLAGKTVSALTDEGFRDDLVVDVRLCRARNDAGDGDQIGLTEVWPVKPLPAANITNYRPPDARALLEAGYESGKAAA